MTQPPVHHNAPPGLRAWLDSVDASREPSVREVTIDGVRCVIKRRRPSLGGGLSYALRYTRALFLGLGCKLFLGEFPRPGVVLRNGLEHEAERLSALLQAGCRVPEVWWRERGLLVLEYVGEDLADLIRNEDSTTRLWLAGRRGGPGGLSRARAVARRRADPQHHAARGRAVAHRLRREHRFGPVASADPGL